MSDLAVTFLIWDLKAAAALAALLAVVVVLQASYRFVVGLVAHARVSVVQVQGVSAARSAEPVGARR